MKSRIVLPVEQELSKVPKHHDVDGLTRWLLLGNLIDPGSPVHVAIHFIGPDVGLATNNGFHYADCDVHEYDEINILWSDDGSLRYRFELDGEVSEVAAPATVIIPAGVRHRAEAIGGTGFYLCIILHSEKAVQDKMD